MCVCGWEAEALEAQDLWAVKIDLVNVTFSGVLQNPSSGTSYVCIYIYAHLYLYYRNTCICWKSSWSLGDNDKTQPLLVTGEIWLYWMWFTDHEGSSRKESLGAAFTDLCPRVSMHFGCAPFPLMVLPRIKYEVSVASTKLPWYLRCRPGSKRPCESGECRKITECG